MKILHKSKRVIPPPAQVTELINKLLSTPEEQIPQVLSEIDVWKWPRSDLNAWIKVLNKFDSMLADIIRDYELDQLQLKHLPESVKKNVSEILRFERLLLENSTNRKMFSSYDRINSLFLAEDLDIVILALKLMLRPAQQYSAQPSVTQALSIPTARLQAFAKRWPHLREYGVSSLDLINPQSSSDIDALPAEAREVSFSFYRTVVPKKAEDEKKMDTDVAETPRASPRKPGAPTSSSSSGAIVVHIDETTLQTKSLMEIMQATSDTYSVPESEKFELLCRIRAATALAKGHEEEREKLLTIRLLSIAIFGHTHPEPQASSSLFLYEPDLIAHIAELLQVDKGVPLSVQTAAIAALDALARYRSRIHEVLTSVNAGVNHGILMGLLRKTVNDIADKDSSIPHTFVDALLSFMTFIASHSSGGNMVVGAGLIPLLVQVLDNKLPHRLPVLSKAMQLLDNVIYSFSNAFGLFCAARGVEALVDRIAYEIELDLKEHGDTLKSREIYGSHGEIPVTRAAVLKHILRSMQRMMQSSGTSEGLRGLIDTSILKSVKKIIEYRGLFGPSVLPIAINIMATFVHNEPTSLTIIQEAGLPEAFYKAIEIGLEPAIEVIQAIPNAIGALCLNDVGQAQLAARPSIIPAIFSIFTSDRHLKVLLDKENAVLMGTAIDELIRHHPKLKIPVFQSIKATMSKIEDLGNSYEPPADIRSWYQLVPANAPTPTTEDDVAMEDANKSEPPTPMPPMLERTEYVQNEYAMPSEESSSKPHDNRIVSFIDVLGRFLEGLFQHNPHCRDFITLTDGLNCLGRLTDLPCLPYDFANSVSSDSMVQVMRTLTEVTTGDTLLHLTKFVGDSLAATRDFWKETGNESKFLSLLEIDDGNIINSNYRFRSLVTLHIRITLLSDVFATAGYAHGRAAMSLLQTLMSESSPQIVQDLGCLHRAAVWENIILKNALISKGIEVAKTPNSSPLDGSPQQPNTSLPEADATVNTSVPNGDGHAQTTPIPAATPPNKDSEVSKTQSPLDLNAAALKHLTHGLPSSLAPFFQAMVKMLHARRTPDAVQRKQISETSAVIARIMVEHLNQNTHGDTLSTYTYYSIMLGLLTVLLVEERTTTSPLYVVQLHALYRAGGLDTMFGVCQKFVSSIKDLQAMKEDDRTESQNQELSHAYGGLKVALHLIHLIISPKSLFEAGHSTLIMTRDKKETDPDYCEPHNFLVRLRLASLPFLRGLWEASWLIQAPLNVSRSVVQAVLELLAGENEEGKESETIPAPLAMLRPADENRIRQLTDMGFPRSAAERALARTHNNVNAATELLLAHPFPFPPDPEPEPATESVSTDENPSEGMPVASIEGSSSDVALTSPPGRTSEEWRKELNDAREPLRAGISRQALRLVDEHLSLIFDLHAAFTRPVNSHQQQAVQDLVGDIRAFSPNAYDVQEQPLANRCRLLALVLCETPSSLSLELRTTLMDSLLALLLSNPRSVDADHPTVPRWLAAHLLVTEALFTLADEPRSITLPKEGEEITAQAIPSGPPLTEARAIIFDFCMRLLAIPDLPNDELLSCLRLFVLLTRDTNVSSQFVKREGLSLLFNRLRASPVNGSSSYIATILRHIVERKATVEHIMRQAVKRYFAQPRTRTSDVAQYVRSCGAMALRDPEVFISVTQSLCQMGSPFSSSPPLSLKIEASPEKPSSPADISALSDMQVDDPSTSSAPLQSEAEEVLTHFLLAELMKSVRAYNELNTASESDDPGNTTEKKDEAQYACFLMQCLTELLFSYNTCKLAFLSYSPKKKPQTPAKEGANRYRTATLSFLLSDLISFGTINPELATMPRSRISLCNWAISVLVALCVDTTATHEPKEISSDLVSVRKFVLETISRAIKDLPQSDSIEERYGRLGALVELCHRLLTVRVNPNSRKQQDETPTHIAKVMLEKNFVATLTTALSEVDLNYPNVRGLVASILRPLELLTKIAIKMSRSSKGKELTEEGVQSDTESSLSSEEGSESAAREETPDLYRNSALGMYSGEMEDTHYGDDEDAEMEEVDDEGDLGSEMDFGEQTGSEDTSDTGDEDDAADFGDEHSTPEEAWDAEDDEDEETDGLVADEEPEPNDAVDDDEEDLDEPADEDEDEDEPDDEMLWQDIHGDDGPEDAEDDAEDDDVAEGQVAAPIHIVHDEGEEDEPDMASDEDEFARGIDNELVRSMFGLSGNTPAEGSGLFVSRRHRADDGLPFGRSRHGNPAPEATTHPLLLDASTGRAASSRSSRGTRQPHHRFVAGAGPDLLQTIEELVGGGAVQLFHHIMTRGRGGGGPETFRLDVQAGAGLANVGRTYIQHRRPHGIMTAVRVERPNRQSQTPAQSRDVDPLLTLQRWSEEVKILHGDFVVERVGRLVNHVILALFPAAIEAVKQAKLREEQEAAKQAQAEVKEEVVASPVPEESSSTAPEAPSTGSMVPQDTTHIPADVPEHGAQPNQEDESMTGTSPVTAEDDAEMVDATVPSVDNVDVVHPPDVESAVTGTLPDAGPSTNAGDSSAPQRVTVMIHGNEVDITDTGVDPTFLEALPDDMREEVLNNHVRDQRMAQIERPADSQISAEFLDALPPEIRAEIIQQEALERSRQRPDESSAGAPAEIDAASFIASLDGPLRQAVLMEQDDGFIQTLPSHMIAEAGTYRESRRPRIVGSRGAASRVPAGSTGRKINPQHDAIQLLDKSGVAVLTRLLFFPQVLKKQLLFKILLHLCENAKTRTELFNLLLNILQDGTGDLAAVDKSFSQMSVRNSKPQKSPGKQKASDYFTAIALPSSQGETVPDLIAQRCLEALNYIVNSHQLSSLFFLTEHELPASLKRTASRKGKGKEKQIPQTHYPIVLLLGLLDRNSLLRTPSIMESVVGLLATVTRPLNNLKDSKPTETTGADPSRPTESSEGPSTSLETSSTEPNAVSGAPNVTEGEQPTSSANGPVSSSKDMTLEAVEERVLLANPPQIPHSVLRLIVNILTVGECSGRTFQQFVALIQHLSHLPDARDIIAEELKAKAQEFGQELYIELDELATTLQTSQGDVLVGSAAAKFSAPSSIQAKLLRVLKTIDYMYSPKSPGAPPSDNSESEKVQAIYETFCFAPLWKRLGDCLSIIEEKPDIEHVATVLLPLIESLMVVCNYVGTKGSTNNATRALRASASPRSPTTPRESMEDLFVSFTDAHRKVLNLMVRNNPSLMSGSFALLVHNPRVLDFDNKRNYFTQQLHRRGHGEPRHGTLTLNVRRARVFEDSFQYLQRKTGEQIKHGKLSVRFYDEEGVDAGGLTREWFQILARQMFDPNNALFQPCAADRLTYQPNKNSWVNPEHLSFFKFVGRVIGKAIYDGRLLDAYFAKSLYRQLLGKPVDYRDVEWVDPEYYNSLCWILENDPTPLELTFSVEADEFGVNRIVPLKENGELIAVTQENKREFVQLSAQYRLYSSIKDQIEHLSTGFYEIIPKDLITIFNEQELELLISGTPDIDVDEWRAATEYNGYTSSDPNIVWWWRALKSFTRDEKAKVLSFATGTSRVPLNGFVDLQGVQGVQRFSIHKAYGESDRLPQAHTCFNQIDLPQYSSYEMLRQQLLLAINEGAEGFGFA